MNKNKKLKKIVLTIIICFFIVAFIGSQFNRLGMYMLAVNNSQYYYFGDLYELSKLKDFKDKLLVVKKDSTAKDIQDADIIAMGDSFFETNYETPKISYELERLTEKKVFHVKREDSASCNDNPLAYLDKIGYVKGSKKYLVLETVERYALGRSVTYQTTTYTKSSAALDKTAKIKNFFKPASLQYFFYNNWLIAPFNYAAKNFRYKVLDESGSSTPIYSKNPKMLFYYEDVNFNNQKVPEEIISIMANNVKFLRDTLKEKYNIELIYSILPTKYSIYGKYTSNYTAYNNFAPQAYKALLKHNINTFDAYTLYTKENNIEEDLLYYKGDSHFTPRGKTIVIQELLKLLSSAMNK
jgi:hypothetical protein